MRKFIHTIVSAALVTALVPGSVSAAPLHPNAFDKPEVDQPGATLEYDSANRLRRVKRGSLDIRYLYDALGNLEAEIVNDGQKVTRTDLMVDESGSLPRIIGALTDDGAKELYAYGPMGLAMVRKTTPGQGTTTYHALTDELGTVRGVADGTGKLAGRIAYDPFGRVRVTEGEQVKLAFTGEYRDTAGLIWLRARHYAPFLGRFLQRDTLVDDPGNPQTLNRYAYAANNPLSNLDPTGHVILEGAVISVFLLIVIFGGMIYAVSAGAGNMAGGGGPNEDTQHEMERGFAATEAGLRAAGVVTGMNGAASAARSQSARLGNSYGVGGANGPRLEVITAPPGWKPPPSRYGAAGEYDRNPQKSVPNSRGVKVSRDGRSDLIPPMQLQEEDLCGYECVRQIATATGGHGPLPPPPKGGMTLKDVETMLNQFPHLEAIETRVSESISVKDAMATGIPQPFAVRTSRGGHLLNIHGETRLGTGTGTVYSDPALGPYLNIEPTGLLQRSIFDPKPFPNGVRVDYAPGARPQ